MEQSIREQAVLQTLGAVEAAVDQVGRAGAQKLAALELNVLCA